MTTANDATTDLGRSYQEALEGVERGDGPETAGPQPISPLRIVEALLFVGGAPLTQARAAEIVRGMTAEQFEETVESLNEAYRRQGRPYAIQAQDGCAGPVSIASAPASGTAFPVGQTTVVVTATDACGNQAKTSFKVTVLPQGTCQIQGPAAICEGDDATLCGPDGDVACLWSTGATTRCITVSKAGSYSLTVTDLGTGCTSSCTHEVQVAPRPVSAITGPDQTCSDSPAELCGPAGNFSYDWSGPDGFAATSPCVHVSAAGTYTLVVTDIASGCSSAPSSHELAAVSCVGACPRPAGYWAAQFGTQLLKGSARFTTQVDQIAPRVNGRARIFAWSDDFAGFRSAINPARPIDSRKQAYRQFSALLANVCAGEAGFVGRNGETVALGVNTPISFPGIAATTVGTLIGEVDRRLQVLAAQPLADVKSQYGVIAGCLEAINSGRGIELSCSDVRPGGNNFSEPDPGVSSPGNPAELPLELSRPTPNPFDRSTRMAYAVAGGGQHVEMAIYDIAGRRVRGLVSGDQAPGRHEVSWDGLADDGSRAEHGVYFLRSEIGTSLRTVRVVYLRR